MLKTSEQKCPKCQQNFIFNRYCGAWVCPNCDNHKGLARCYCGWTQNGNNNGREELEEMGETIDPEE